MVRMAAHKNSKENKYRIKMFLQKKTKANLNNLDKELNCQHILP